MRSQGEFLLFHILGSFANLSKKNVTGQLAEENIDDATETLWFDYADSDKKKILDVYKFIGEKPEFIAPNTFPQLLRYILVGSILIILLFFIYQIVQALLRKRL